MIKTKKLALHSAIGLALTVAAPFSFGEEQKTESVKKNQIEIIEVTAQKRVQSLQTVPISIQAIHGSELAQNNVTRFQDLSDNMPNVTIAKSSTNARVYIRGIGTDSNAGFEQSVAIFNDGVYMGRGQQSKFPFIDVERVEVLKGPQGILFGKNATAGALSIVTKDPTDEPEGEVRLAFGEYGDQTAHAIFSGPLSENLAGRVAVFGRNLDGYMYNTELDRNEEQREEMGGRGTLLWTPSDETLVNLKWETGTFKTVGSNYQVTYDPAAASKLEPLMGEGEFDQRSAIANEGLLGGGPVANKTKLDNIALRIEHGFGNYQLVSITGFSEYTWDNAIDADFSKLSIAYQDRDEDFSQFSQEIRLLSPLHDKYDYIIGAYYQTNDLGIDVYTSADATLLGAPITAGGFEQFRQTSDTLALFGQLNYHLTDRLTATFGLRWADEDKQATADMVTGLYDLTPDPVGSFVMARLGGADHNLDESRNENHVSPMFGIQWQQNDDTMYYASFSKGFKGGGFDASGLNGSMGTVPDDSFEFEEEEVNAIEIGGKTKLQDGEAVFNWALYRSEYEDLQVSTYNGAGFVIGNAAKAVVQGIEAEYMWMMNDELTLSINSAYLDFEYKEFTNAPCTVSQEAIWASDGDCQQDLTGERGALTPKLTASANLNYITEVSSSLEFRADLSLNYSGEYNTESDLDPNLIQDSFTKVNLYVALADSSDYLWEVALIGKNLTNEYISSAGNDNPLIDYAYRRYLEMPRQWTVQGTYRF
ncbi:TonB-dependent receptor [Thalassotalea sp. LPB0316]|uniref:TonB-dependent receptor n=1 Tax=Thalassotalea sp. LPB0316 TaxID=2769490 RepID=UPI00186723B1|nr:TonB-dependent receptor [Thalassotalea sp. LPB0316]QOL25142.1 TonB-dependent receptor [Thalassotalea sp. LPB0316]